MQRSENGMKKSTPVPASAALTAAIIASLAGATAPALAQSTSSASLIEEVVVTARKREESILDTPIAITAISSEAISAKGIVSFNQLADNTPGITISNISSGRSDRSFQQITLRGFVPSTTLSTLTATFIDGAPVASPSAVAVVTDPARIEILKGPQSAYFGRNTFAGAVNVVNKMPGKDLGGSVTLMGGTRNNMDFTGSVDGPLFSGNAGFRLGVHYMNKDGSYKNQANLSQTLGDQETKTVTLMLTAEPTDNFTAKLFTMFSKDDDGPSTQGQLSAYEVRSNNGITNVPLLSGSSAGTLVLPSMANCTLLGFAAGREATEARVSRPFICGAAPKLPKGYSPAQNIVPAALLARALDNGAQRVVSPSDGVKGYGLVREYWHSHLNLDWKLNDAFTLTSLTSINDEFYSEVEDLDNYNTSAFINPLNPTGANANLNAYWDYVYGVERETRDFSQELRLSYDAGGALSGTFGASYLKTLVWNDLIAITNEIVSGTARVPQVGKNPVDTKGVFFGATYKLNDALKITAEGRYQRDKVAGFTGSNPAGVTVGTVAAAQYGINAGKYGPLQKLIEREYNNFLPRLIAQYDFNPDLMGYASYSKGVSVGVNTFNTSFLSLSALGLQYANELGISVVQKPERLKNYEVGLKGKFLEGRVVAQAAAYYAVWDDQLNYRQRIYAELPIAQGGPGGTGQVVGYANTGGTDLKGFEVDIAAKVGDRIDLSFAAALNDSSVKSYATPSVSQVTGVIGDGFKGKQLPQTSRMSANLGAQYTAPLATWGDAEWFARGDLSWKDKQYVDAANLTWIRARTVANVRAGVKRGPLSIDAYVLNLFNDDNYVSIAQNSLLVPTFAVAGNAYLNLGLPELRTYGVRVGYKF